MSHSPFLTRLLDQCCCCCCCCRRLQRSHGRRSLRPAVRDMDSYEPMLAQSPTRRMMPHYRPETSRSPVRMGRPPTGGPVGSPSPVAHAGSDSRSRRQRESFVAALGTVPRIKTPNLPRPQEVTDSHRYTPSHGDVPTRATDSSPATLPVPPGTASASRSVRLICLKSSQRGVAWACG